METTWTTQFKGERDNWFRGTSLQNLSLAFYRRYAPENDDIPVSPSPSNLDVDRCERDLGTSLLNPSRKKKPGVCAWQQPWCMQASQPSTATPLQAGMQIATYAVLEGS